MYWTLNFFETGTFKRVQIDDNDTVGTRVETVSYTLGVDIDHCEGTDIHAPDVKKAVEDMGAFFVKAIQKTQPKSVYAAYSGGGIYVYIHHRIWDKYFKAAEDQDLAVYVLTNSYNRWIADKSAEFFKLHPEHAGNVKADALNNAKRVFKTILSIHKKLPYAVVPLDTNDIKIDFEAANLPIKSIVIEQAASWYKTYDPETHFQDELKPYYEDILLKWENKEFVRDIKISDIALKDTEKFPPCIKSILNAQSMPAGKTRATAIIAAFLGQAGWDKDEAHELYMTVVNTLHAETSNIFESWYKKMSCPGCKIINEKGGSFPCVSMGDIGICAPDSFCKTIKNPIQYLTTTNGNGKEGSEEPQYEELDIDAINQRQIKENNRRLVINMPEDHFVSQYVKWQSGLSDAYMDYHIADALWLLSALTRGRVILNLKQERIKPNLWIFVIGKSTTSRKSTAVNKARKIYEVATEVDLPNDDYSIEGYLEALSIQPITTNVRDEAAGFLAKCHKKYNDGIFDLECQLYDGQNVKKTLASGGKKEPKTFSIKNPYVTKLYASTGDNFARYMQIEDFTCGYGFRWLYAYPKYKKDRMALALTDEGDIKAWAEILVRVKTLHKFFVNLHEPLEFKVTPEAMKYHDSICVELERVAEEQNNDILNSVIGRSEIHILKIAMLLELGKSAPFGQSFETISDTITLETMIEAAQMVTNYFIPSAMELIEQLQEDARNNNIERITAVLRRMGGKAKHADVLRNCHLTSRDFNECINTMMESRAIDIVTEKESKGKYYILLSHNKEFKIRDNSNVSNVSIVSIVSTLAQVKNISANNANSGTEDIIAKPYDLPLVITPLKMKMYANGVNDANDANVANDVTSTGANIKISTEVAELTQEEKPSANDANSGTKDISISASGGIILSPVNVNDNANVIDMVRQPLMIWCSGCTFCDIKRPMPIETCIPCITKTIEPYFPTPFLKNLNLKEYEGAKKAISLFMNHLVKKPSAFRSK